ncbi:MAG: EamA family transporter, partial [Candidatus Zixiibacteriota bacterium]
MFAYLGEIAALGTAACWSFTAVFFSEAGRRLGSFKVNQIRLFLAVVIYSLVLYFRFGWVLPPDLNARQFWLLAGSGIIGLVIGDGAGFKA